MTPAEGEEISVASPNGAGKLIVEMSSGSLSDITIFDSGANKPVTNLIIQGGKQSRLQVTLSADVQNVTLYGSETNSRVTLTSSSFIRGNFLFVGHARCQDDTIFLNQVTDILGNATFDMKGGTNSVFNQGGGTLGGNVTYRGGNGNDTFNLAMNDATNIKGNLTIVDTGGLNTIACNTGRAITVEKNVPVHAPY